MSRGEPMVSIAMVTYRQQDLIGRAIKGVVKQKVTFPIELVIVDDCSPDDTYAVAESWRQRYPDIIRLYRNETNVGVQENYLRAFSHCRGRYLALCDADDYWCDRRKLSRQTAYMEANPACALTFHRVINHYADTGEKSLSNPHQKVDCGLLELSRGNFITNCSVLYRRSMVDLQHLPTWFTDDGIWPDYPLHMLYARCGAIHYFSKPMAVYRRGGVGEWTAAGEYDRQMKALTVRRHLLRELEGENEAVEGLREAVRNILIAIADVAPNEAVCADVRRQLHEEYDCTDSQIDTLIGLRHRGRPIHKRLFTVGRRIVSRMLPLPKP